MVEDAQHQGEGKVPLSSDFDAWVHFISLTLVLFVFFFPVKCGSLKVSALLQKWLV